MKKIIYLIVILSVAFTAPGAYAQGKLKFGHIDSNKLLSLMPEREKAQKTMQDYAKQLEEQLQSMQGEFDKKYNELASQQDSLSSLIKQTKTKELEDLQERIQTFKTTAQQDLATKENELIEPILTKAKKAIEEVGKEKGFTYIFDISSQVVLYFSAESEDVLPVVKAKLGIQ